MTEQRRAHQAAEDAARESYGKLLSYLASRCGDIHAAEDALADAFARAIDRWPAEGVPATPEAWLLVTARNRLIDVARRGESSRRLAERLADAASQAELEVERTDELGDERLAMMFACANPALPPAIHGPLMLQAVLGVSADRIASAFLIAPSAMSQRLVRAKRKIANAGIPLRVPAVSELPSRLDAVLCAVYAAFCAGWDDPAGLDARSSGFAAEALLLGRLIVRLCPQEPEPLGLVALMLHAHARRAARRSADGSYVPLDVQDTQRWDGKAIDEAESLLKRALSLRRTGRFVLEAAIQSAHSIRRFGRPPDRRAIVTLYDALLKLTGSPVIAVNRAVALARVDGAAAGLAALPVDSASTLASYQPYWAARAELEWLAGEVESARSSFARAIGLTADPAARAYLAKRLDSLGELAR